MDWGVATRSLFDELEKIAEERKSRAKKVGDLTDKVVEMGAPILGGAGVGRTLSDLSLSTEVGPTPRRKTLGALIGALGGYAYHRHKQKKKAQRRAARLASQPKAKTAAPFVFKGVATKRFLSKPGPTVKDVSPKIGRIGTLPK